MIVWIEFGPVVSMRVAVDALSLCLPCPSVGRPAKSESIKVSLNQDNKSKEGRKEDGVDTKDSLCAKAAPPRTCAEPKRPVFVTLSSVLLTLSPQPG